MVVIRPSRYYPSPSPPFGDGSHLHVKTMEKERPLRKASVRTGAGSHATEGTRFNRKSRLLLLRKCMHMGI